MAVLIRALQLIDVIAEQADGIGVNQLSALLAEPPATVHRLLASLRELGLVRQDVTTKRYRLGPAALRWAQAFLRQDTVSTAAQPFLDALRSALSESVFLTELVGDQALCVATSESPRPLRFFMSVGQRMPWHAAASARAILAFRPDDEVRRLLREERLRAFTTATPISVERVLAEVRDVRANGFAICEEELETGVTALAAPVHDGAGSVVASVSVVAPSQRLQRSTWHPVARELVRTADLISVRLGHHPTGPARAPSRSIPAS